MRHVLVRRLKTSLAVRLGLLALLLTVPILSVAATQYKDVGNQIALVQRERRGVAFIRSGSALLQAVGAVRLEPQPTKAAPDAVRMSAGDRRSVAKRLATFEEMAPHLRDLGVGWAVTAPAFAAWRSFQTAPSPALLATLGTSVLKADSFVADASRLAFESHVVEGNLADALSTQNDVILQRLSIASATAEAGALRPAISVADRIAIATYIGSADAAMVNLDADRTGAVDAGAALDERLEAGWDAVERSAAELRRPLALVVRGERSAAVAASELSPRMVRLVQASDRFGTLLDRQLGALFDARLEAARHAQWLVIVGSLVAALGSGGVVALIGWAVVRRDRHELLRAQQQARTLSAELAQQRAEKALLLTQAQFSAIFERSNMGIALLDAKGETREANARLKEMLDGAEVIPPDDVAFAGLVQGSTATYHCERSFERDGVRRWLEMTVSLVSAPSPVSVTAIAMLRDITERKGLEERMRYAAMHDELTSLANRSQFVACLEQELATDASRASAFAVLFIDLDDFKLVNDTLGHHAGDQVLLVTGRRIAAASRDVDLIARFHGDEFAVLLREVVGEGAAEAAAERIRSELKAPMSIDGQLVVVSCSIGVVIGDGSYASAEELLRHADAAMYRTKSLGHSHDLLPRRPPRLTSVSSIAS